MTEINYEKLSIDPHTQFSLTDTFFLSIISNVNQWLWVWMDLHLKKKLLHLLCDNNLKMQKKSCNSSEIP